ncbi:23278_t:CDS:1 [Dentiscutata erythropus]|uniref:23278_t:CDS:1 n=1 Tax=Dentiscutata erythropus TaxID=1348616 RepID=A0A9N9B092_9GLOM|nr:23278_t:CDS:1 [Dentiscutata erythropus]
MIILSTDCLYQIFKHFKDDLKTLHSCLLSNRTCCELIIPILWADPWKLILKKKPTSECKFSFISLLSTLLSCLPFESKRLLHENNVYPTSQATFFNYAIYCRSLNFDGIWDMLSAQHRPFGILNIDIKTLVGQEICKMIIIRSTKITQILISKVSYSFFDLFQNLLLNNTSSLSHLIEFEYHVTTDSNIPTFYNLFKVCKNISTLTINLKTTPSKSFIELIRSQSAIKFMNITFKYDPPNKFINSLLLHANILTHLYISCFHEDIFPKIFFKCPTFSNLKFLKCHNSYTEPIYPKYQHLKNMKSVNISLPNLESLEFDCETLFLYQVMAQIIKGTRGKLERIYISYPIYYVNPSIINQSILNSCSNLKVLTTFVTKDTLEIILAILTSCQNLEGIALYSYSDGINSILNHLSLHPLRNLNNIKFDNTDSCWNFSLKNMELFLKSLEKEDFVNKLNISLIYKQINVNPNKIMDLFETYYSRGIIASYFVESKTNIIYEFDDWQRLQI